MKYVYIHNLEHKSFSRN